MRPGSVSTDTQVYRHSRCVYSEIKQQYGNGLQDTTEVDTQFNYQNQKLTP